MEVWGRQEETSASTVPKARKQSRMNGNWGQGKQNELGNGRRDDHYP